LLFLY